jgi:hypothetical protein
MRGEFQAKRPRDFRNGWLAQDVPTAHNDPHTRPIALRSRQPIAPKAPTTNKAG